MVELPADWRAFRDHIEGNEGPFSCAVINGKPHLHATAIQLNASPTLAPLADLLRSDAVIPREIRDWLADMITPGTGRACSLSIQRNPGRPRGSVLAHMDAVEYFDDLRALPEPERMSHKRAEHMTCEKFNITRSTLSAARRKINQANDVGRSN